MFRYLLIFSFVLVSALSSYAQDQPNNTKTIYYEYDFATTYNYDYSLDYMLLRENVCLERIIQLNPDLDITYLDYGQKIIIPADEPCYLIDNIRAWDTNNPPSRLKYYENGEWLGEPYYSDEIVYIRSFSDKLTMDKLVRQYNVCAEDILKENILLHDFATYEKYAHITTMDIFVSDDLPHCDHPSQPSSIAEITIKQLDHIVSPRYVTEKLNICTDEILNPRIFSKRLNYIVHDDVIGYPVNAKPCYNEQGQRLQYYDLSGQQLEEPIYSDFEVYIAPSDNTMNAIARKFNVCLVDLLRLNGFASVPIHGELEILIPPQRPCPNDIEAVNVDLKLRNLALSPGSTLAQQELRTLSEMFNLCEDTILELNPHLHQTGYILDKHILSESDQDHWIITPLNLSSCYHVYEIQEDDQLWDVQEKYNVCFEEFITDAEYRRLWHYSHGRQLYEYVPINALPCFNDAGQRLYYPYYPHDSNSPKYVDMQVYIAQPTENLYEISQRFNVCVHDLMKMNRVLVSQDKKWGVNNWQLIIPQTRSCYDDETGMPLIYEDENGQPLDQPIMSDTLIHYGSWRDLMFYNYYNVCSNRIRDANQEKLDGRTNYLGWIIPTDRPPCTDESSKHIDYVCYTQPIDISVDYRDIEEEISFDIDGDYCYDLAKEGTVIWYQNKLYEALTPYNLAVNPRYWQHCLRFTDEPLDESFSPYKKYSGHYTCLVPSGFNLISSANSTIHTVATWETLSSIGELYDMPYQFIADANDISPEHQLFAATRLMIPSGFTWTGLRTFIGTVIAIVGTIGFLIGRKRRRYQKKKHMPKNESLHS